MRPTKANHMIKYLRDIEAVFKKHEQVGGGHCCCMSCHIMLSIQVFTGKSDLYTDEELINAGNAVIMKELETLRAQHLAKATQPA